MTMTTARDDPCFSVAALPELLAERSRSGKPEGAGRLVVVTAAAAGLN